MKGSHPIWIIKESHAKEDLIAYIQHEASLDDLVRLYSMLIQSGAVEVIGENEVHSFVYRNGRRVKTREERSK